MENFALVVVLLASLLPGLMGDANIMKDVTLGFGEAFKGCREESHLTEEDMEEFFHIWRDDFQFNKRELGCAILCMSRYFDLMTDTTRMHHEKMDKFINSFENGEKISATVIQFIHGCEKQFDDMDDHCERILRIAECFKGKCKQSGLAPEMELLLAEFIMEAENK